MTESPMNLTMPAGLAATMIMRPIASSSGAPVKGLTGADIALWLTIMHGYYYQGAGGQMRIEQKLITLRFGRITRERMLDAMRRLTGSEIYLADVDRWVPAIVASYEHPMPRKDPRVPVAPEWQFDIDEDLAREWRDGVNTAALRIACDKLRELTSRHSVIAYLRLQIWSKRAGIVPPDHWNLKLPLKGVGMRLEVPVAELGDFYGYDGRLPASKVATLFTTGSGNRGVLERELIRAGIDYECVPVMSAWHSKPVAFRVRMGVRVVSLAAMTDGRWTDLGEVRPKRGAGKNAKRRTPAKQNDPDRVDG